MVYKIRVILDAKDTIFRDIEVKEKQTLWNLHNGIKSAFSLQGDELSAFNFIESDGTITKTVPLEDMSDDGDGEIMSDIYLLEAFEKTGDKLHFQFGFLDLWDFFCELVEIIDEKKSVNYPITVFRFGKVPLKAPSKDSGASKAKKSPIMMDDDFALDDSFGGDFADEDDDFDDGDDNFENDYYDDNEEI